MIQNDVIEKVKFSTWAKYYLENGIPDIRMGISLIALGLIINFFDSSFYQGVIIALFFLTPLVQRIQKKYVYPRSGYVIFSKNKVQFNAKPAYMLTAYYTLSIVLGALFFIIEKDNSFHLNYLYANIWVTGLLALTVIGGLIRNSKFYLYAAMLIIPLAVPTTYAGNYYFMVITLVIFIISVILFEKPGFWNENEPELNPDYIKLGHNIILVLASMLFLYMIFVLSHVEITKSINLIINQTLGRTNVLFIGMPLIIWLFYGYFLRFFRYIFYSFLLCLYVSLCILVSTFHFHFWYACIGLGIVNICVGIITLIRYVRKYPILEAADER